MKELRFDTDGCWIIRSPYGCLLIRMILEGDLYLLGKTCATGFTIQQWCATALIV